MHRWGSCYHFPCWPQLPIFIQLWRQDSRSRSAGKSAAQHCSWDTHAHSGNSCKCTVSVHMHTALVAQGLRAGQTNLQRHKQLIHGPVSKRRQRTWQRNCGAGALVGLNVLVTSSAFREPLTVLSLRQAGGSIQLRHPHQASHADSHARTELHPLAAGGKIQQRNFQRREFWWKLMNQTFSL